LDKLLHKYQFTAHIEYDAESKMYYGYIPTLPSVQSYASNIDELNKNLSEVLSLVLDELSLEEVEEAVSHFVGTSILQVS
jgi:predicted RNase H-like HicB family nuclease